MQHIGIVIRADGTFPFDDGIHPDHKTAMIGHLVQLGHAVTHAPDGKSVKLANFSPKLHAKLEAAHHARLAAQKP